MKFSPGRPETGFLLCFAFALLAQMGTLSAGLVWDDSVFLLQDERLRDLSFVYRCFGESYFGGLSDNEMYRPIVNASFAIDWFLSGSAPGDVGATWFHTVNLFLHAINAGIAYLFLANVVTRPLGAPLLGAILFAVHPLAVEPTAWIVGRCDLLAAGFGMASATLLLRSVRAPKLLVPAVICYGVALFAKASAATMPLVCALAVIAYREVPPGRLLGKRHVKRFGAFVIPIVIWIGARWAVLGAPFPRAGGRKWIEGNVSVLDHLLGIGRAVMIYGQNLVLPVNLCGDYAGDRASLPHVWSGQLGWMAPVGLVVLIASLAFGIRYLRKWPRAAFPLLAFIVTLVPVVQLVPIGAILADRFLYLPALFFFLLVGEGFERLFERFSWIAFPLPIVVFVLLGLSSHQRAEVWVDDVAFNRDVLRAYPDARSASQRLALALSETGEAADRAEARALLERFLQLARPDEELALLGAMAIEDGDDVAAEKLLLQAQDAAGGKARLGAHIRYNLALIHKRREQYVAARNLLEEALERMPEFPAARRMLDGLPE